MMAIDEDEVFHAPEEYWNIGIMEYWGIFFSQYSKSPLLQIVNTIPLPKIELFRYNKRISRRMSAPLPPMQSPKRPAGILDIKQQKKVELQESFGWPAEPKRPMACLPAGMTEKLGGAVFQELLPGLLTLPLELLVVGKGSASYGTLFTTLAREHKHRVHIITDTDASLSAMYEACDIGLFLSDPRSMKELRYCMEAAIVPVSLPCPVLENYDPVQESGNAFLYETPNAWQCFAALVRAMETYKLPFDWRTIQRNGMDVVRDSE